MTDLLAAISMTVLTALLLIERWLMHWVIRSKPAGIAARRADFLLPLNGWAAIGGGAFAIAAWVLFALGS